MLFFLCLIFPIESKDSIRRTSFKFMLKDD